MGTSCPATLIPEINLEVQLHNAPNGAVSGIIDTSQGSVKSTNGDKVNVCITETDKTFYVIMPSAHADSAAAEAAFDYTYNLVLS